MNDWIDFHALGQIVLIGLICGAGLPAVFAVGLKALHFGAPATGSDSDELVGGNALGVTAAVVCFAVVLGAIVWGIYLIVAGT
jgi:hypothetical protein